MITIDLASLQLLWHFYNLFYYMQSASFLFALDFSSILVALAGYRVLQSMHCGNHCIYLDLLIKHFQTGMYTALKGC